MNKYTVIFGIADITTNIFDDMFNEQSRDLIKDQIADRC